MATRAASPRKIESKTKPQSVPAAPRTAGREADEAQGAKSQSPTAVQPVEPEDAYLTGVSRSLQRRLLGLNVDGARGQAKPHPEAAAGLHSTGSYTEKADAPAKDAKKSRKA